MLNPKSTHHTEQGASRRFIIGFGRVTDVDVIEAADLKAARDEAAKRCIAEGLLDDDLADHAWAEPYTETLARDLGVLPCTEDDHSAIKCDPRKFAAKGW